MGVKTADADNLITNILKGIENLKGRDISILDLRAIENTASSYFIICDGTSNTHVTALVNSIHKTVSKELHEKPYHTEGLEVAEWVLIDYVNVVVHVFQKHIREKYSIEALWGDAEVTSIASNY
jgi:ribosome-associated protein